MLPIHEVEVPFSRKPFEIITRANQLYRLKEAIENQHKVQTKQSNLNY